MAEGLHATELGPEGAEPVVFLHGLFGQGRNWTSIGKALAERSRVLLLDLPDHGRSPWTTAVSYAGMADAVAAELQARGGRWSVVGHSMGGKVAMTLALTRPDLVARLVVADIAPVSYARIGQEEYVAAMRSIDLDGLGERSAAERQLNGLVDDPTIAGFLLQNLRRTRAAHGTQHWGWQHNLALLGDSLRTLADWPDLGRPPYQGPTLWIAGADSTYITAEHVPAMRALFPHERLVTIKHAAHWVHADQPDVFLATLRAFLANAPAYSTS